MGFRVYYTDSRSEAPSPSPEDLQKSHKPLALPVPKPFPSLSSLQILNPSTLNPSGLERGFDEDGPSYSYAEARNILSIYLPIWPSTYTYNVRTARP